MIQLHYVTFTGSSSIFLSFHLLRPVSFSFSHLWSKRKPDNMMCEVFSLLLLQLSFFSFTGQGKELSRLWSYTETYTFSLIFSFLSSSLTRDENSTQTRIAKVLLLPLSLSFRNAAHMFILFRSFLSYVHLFHPDFILLILPLTTSHLLYVIESNMSIEKGRWVYFLGFV